VNMLVSRLGWAYRQLQQWLGSEGTTSKLGDFTTTLRVIPLSLMAVAIGVLNAFVALALLKLIGIFTNLFFFQRWGTALVSPASNTLGLWELWVPVIGALIIGVMARAMAQSAFAGTVSLRPSNPFSSMEVEWSRAWRC
jgi:hypothetical protein